MARLKLGWRVMLRPSVRGVKLRAAHDRILLCPTHGRLIGLTLDLWRDRRRNVHGISGRSLLFLGNDVLAQRLLCRRLDSAAHFPELTYLRQASLLELLIQ